MNESQKALCALLRTALWEEPYGTETEIPWQEVFQEADEQAVTLLFADILGKLPMPPEISEEWESRNERQYSDNMRLLYEQDEFRKGMEEENIPFLILKGSAAAVYYPNPMLRTMGDVDVIVRREDLGKARAWMEKEGFFSLNPKDKDPREYQYSKDGVPFELHSRFSIFNEREKDTLLDGWIYEAAEQAEAGQMDVYTFPMAGKTLNGLVLLAHVNQHLEEGLGLRQIIDWIMYVKQELTDEKWESFRDKAEQLGMMKLAKASARAGQIYLGLPEKGYSWCMDLEPEICESLMEYIFECGNFGMKGGVHNDVTMVMSHGKGIQGFFRNLQRRGEGNWTVLKRAPWLRPFAWIYQAGRYVSKGIRRGISVKELKADAAASRRRNALTEALGTTQLARRDSSPR